MDGFKIKESTKICVVHFPLSQVLKIPGGTKKKLINGAKPTLHSWNNFGKDVHTRKAPVDRASRRKKCRFMMNEDNEGEGSSSTQDADKAKNDNKDLLEDENKKLKEQLSKLEEDLLSSKNKFWKCQLALK